MKLHEAYDIHKLYFRYNADDECWEILERDVFPKTDDQSEDDALLAKFYDGDADGSVLAGFVSEKINEERLNS